MTIENLARPDPDIRDNRAAAGLFLAATLILALGASLGLNAWPGHDMVSSVATGTLQDMYMAFHGYGLIFVAIFWASRPALRMQVLVLIGWLLTSLLLHSALPDSMSMSWTGSARFPYTMFFASSLGLPCLLALLWRAVRPQPPGGDWVFEKRLQWLLGLSVLFAMVPSSALNLTSVLHPQTFDFYALHFDRAAGLSFTTALTSAVRAVPGLSELVLLSYNLTPLGFLSVALLHLRGKPRHVAPALATWVVLSTCALMAYHAFPITGPLYIFGTDGLVQALRPSNPLPLDRMTVPSFPRNGMPSMHFGWMLAATLIWWRSGTGWVSRCILIAMTALTAVATLYKGEHYTIDLIVAVPFVLAAIALCSSGVAWSGSNRRGIVVLGFAAWLLWVVLLRTQIVAFVESPWLCWLLIAATALVVVQQARWMAAFSGAPLASAGRFESEIPAHDLAAAGLQRRLSVMFFVSGAAALVYQVLFAKQLALVFGSTATATFTVLATFLGGMALGSLIGGHLAHRLKRPLQAYALIEVGIAGYCVLTPALFTLVQSAYVSLASGLAPDAPWLMALRVTLGVGVLVLPTVLMGTTLPMLAQAAGPSTGRLGHRVAWLYFANTAGAALGALLTAYFVIPAVGARSTTLIAAMLNLMIALAAIELAKSESAESPVQTRQAPLPMQSPGHILPAHARWAALAVLGIGGVLSLGLEVVYVHLLSIVAGNSVYAFGLMVATFLVGLSLGGEAARRWLLQAQIDAIPKLISVLLGLCLSVALGALVWDQVPGYFASFANYPLAREFSAREAIRGLVCALIMVPPTLFIGALYVVAMDIALSADQQASSIALGIGAAVNTLGNIAGVLLFGFVVLPVWGGLNSGRAIAIAALIMAVALTALGARRDKRVLAALVLTGLVVAWSLTKPLDYQQLSTGANVYFQAQNWGKVVDHAESIDGGLTSVTTQDGSNGPVLTLLTNGKFQGNDANGGEMRAQLGFALAPLLHQSNRQRALVIGFGTGVTTRVFHEAGFQQVDVAELSGDIVRMSNQHFGRVNRGVSKAAGVNMHVTDGRNLLLLSPHKFDVISLEITSIWFAGAASLYNQQFYQLARAHLQDDGVLQQWLQLHRLSGMDLLHIIGTLRSEFRYVSLYVMGGQGILVATNSADKAHPVEGAIDALSQAPALADALQIVGRPPHALVEDRLLRPAGVDRFLLEIGVDPIAWISTDDNLRLEYDTPKANVNDASKSMQANMTLLSRFKQ